MYLILYKETHKTPKKELSTALLRKRNYIQRRTCMTLQEYKKQKMQNPDFSAAYDEIQPEMDIIRAIIDARISQNMTQKELSERTGINQTEISRLENGSRNPSIKLLQRLAEGMGMTLKVSFVPRQTR